MSARPGIQPTAARPRHNSGVVVRGADSWLELVAATTKGVGHRRSVRVHIRTASPLRGNAFRLVVQSYAASSLRFGSVPGGSATPVASLQRAVSPEELRLGLDLDVIHVGFDGDGSSDFVVFAWVEPGRPDLEYDAALARPSRGALLGSALSQTDVVGGLTAELSLTAA